ncbi:unnamed protein product [Brassicogethes aeneus]|uniref:Translational activator of cytochrome c oxidase 1 n=1 Tax=Brassicogethes aeneus TaxID=1431903 RepID=A0A9P0AV94_BRAAE|nr:unnamed protein product [Brassicogethes aeneus]
MIGNLCKKGHFLCQNACNFLVIQCRNAGHSKWQNIKHIKGLKDAEKSQTFGKIGRHMKVAVAEGGSTDPKSNLKLAQIIEQAKRANMPQATIASILKSSQADKSGAKSHLIEIKGPGSCIILCEVFTSNLNQLKQSIATSLKKTGAKFGDGGGMHIFEEKGIIEAEIPENLLGKAEEMIIESATDHAIESGAEDVRIDDKTLLFLCGKSNLNSVVTELENFKYKVTSASVEFIPLKTQSLQEMELQSCANLYERLQNMPELVKLTDNIA